MIGLDYRDSLDKERERGREKEREIETDRQRERERERERERQTDRQTDREEGEGEGSEYNVFMVKVSSKVIKHTHIQRKTLNQMLGL